MVLEREHPQPLKNYFHPETLRRISRLDLRARHVVEGFLSGMHKSRHFGNSIEFRQHRQYVQGDDPRSVDWKVWARQDRLYVKQYEVDTNLRCSILLDVSKSMLYGSGPFSKYDYACTIAASLAYLAILQQDAVGFVTFEKETDSILPARMKQSHLAAIVATMQQHDPARRNTEKKADLPLNELLAQNKSIQPNIKESLRHAAESVPPHGLIVIISDLLVQRDGLFQGLNFLRSRDHDILILHVLDDEELDFTLKGPTSFEGLEIPAVIRCDPRMLRKGYLEAVNDYIEEIRRGCSLTHADYSIFRTSTPLDAALSAYLSKRNATLRNRLAGKK